MSDTLPLTLATGITLLGMRNVEKIFFMLWERQYRAAENIQYMFNVHKGLRLLTMIK